MKKKKPNRYLKGGIRVREDGSFVNPAAARLSRRGFLGGVAAGVGAAAYGMSGVSSATGIPSYHFPVTYIGEDRETGGNWIENYGDCAWVLSAMCAPPGTEWPVPPYYYDLTGGWLFNCGFDYSVYTCKPGIHCHCPDDDCLNKATEDCDETKRRAACWFTSNEATITLSNIPTPQLPGKPPGRHYDLYLYLLDWDSPESNKRRESFTIMSNFIDWAGPIEETGPVEYDPNYPNIPGHPTSGEISDYTCGKLIHFCVFVPAGGANAGKIVIKMKRLGGSNAVLSGIFLKPTETQCIPNHWYHGKYIVDDETIFDGNWVGTGIGDYWALLCAFNKPNDPICFDPESEPNPSGINASFTGDRWTWTGYLDIGPEIPCNNCDQENMVKSPVFAWSWGDRYPDMALEIPDIELPEGCSAATSQSGTWASCYDDEGSPNMWVDLHLPPYDEYNPDCGEGCYKVSFYAYDPDHFYGPEHIQYFCRRQVIEIYNENCELVANSPIDLTPLPPSPPYPDPDFADLVGPGVYHSFWMPAGQYYVKIRKTGCSNAVLSGIFVDCVECPKGSHDFRTIGFWKHNFNLACNPPKNSKRMHNGLIKGQQIDNETLQSYLDMIDTPPTFCSEMFQGLDFCTAYEILSFGDDKTDPCNKAMAQLLALWLNLANGAAYWNEPVYDIVHCHNEEFGQLICKLEEWIASGEPKKCKWALTIADTLNNSGYE